MDVTIDLATMVMQPSSPDRAGASRHAPDDAFGISLTLRHVTPKGYTHVYARLPYSNLLDDSLDIRLSSRHVIQSGSPQLMPRGLNSGSSVLPGPAGIERRLGRWQAVKTGMSSDLSQDIRIFTRQEQHQPQKQQQNQEAAKTPGEDLGHGCERSP
jgi:hypothetical protein